MSKRLSSPRRRLFRLPTKDIEELSMTKRKLQMSEGAKVCFGSIQHQDWRDFVKEKTGAIEQCNIQEESFSWEQ